MFLPGLTGSEKNARAENNSLTINPLPLFMVTKFGIVFASLLYLSTSHAQSDPPKLPEQKIYETIDIQKMPEFPGGESEMMRFLIENLKYPAVAKENNVQGVVVLSFVVAKDGALSESKILKDIGGGCGKEAMRVVQTMPKWIPGEAQGVPVKVRYTLPVRFKLEENSTKSSREKGLLSKEDMFKLVAEAAKNILQISGEVTYPTPIDLQKKEAQKLLGSLELATKAKLSEADKKGFTQIGQVSDYFYTAQYAPVFYSGTQFMGKQVKFLTNRVNFDVNADGMGKTGSIKVPKGVKVVFYAKQNFKGKKLELDAKDGALEIPDLGNIQPEKGKIKDSGKGLNWGLNTQSMKVILPKVFPE